MSSERKGSLSATMDKVKDVLGIKHSTAADDVSGRRPSLNAPTGADARVSSVPGDQRAGIGMGYGASEGVDTMNPNVQDEFKSELGQPPYKAGYLNTGSISAQGGQGGVHHPSPLAQHTEATHTFPGTGGGFASSGNGTATGSGEQVRMDPHASTGSERRQSAIDSAIHAGEAPATRSDVAGPHSTYIANVLDPNVGHK